MSESLNLEILTQMLDRMPGVAFCSRTDPVTGQSKWLYINRRAAELYDVSEEELQADPNTGLSRIVPDDRARVDAVIAECSRTGAPMAFAGRIQRRSGEIRWVETHANIVIEENGTVLWYGQSIDVTERKQLEQSLVQSEAARAQSEALYRQVIDALPVGVALLDTNGKFGIYNDAMKAMSGSPDARYEGDLSSSFGVFRVDGVTPFPDAEMPIVRALGGETGAEAELFMRNAALTEGKRILVKALPMKDAAGNITAAVAVATDVTEQRKLEHELRSRNEELAESEAAKAQLIERLRYSIDELSNPILEVWDDVLAMPIIGVVDSRRTADMVQRLLGEVARTQASFVIIDLTGVEIVDTRTADHLMKLMRKVEIVGARCVLTGIRPAVAETLVDIGVDFGRLVTLRNLKHGLREALRSARREREGLREIDIDELTGQETKVKPAR